MKTAFHKSLFINACAKMFHFDAEILIFPARVGPLNPPEGDLYDVVFQIEMFRFVPNKMN
jgi:hypothetical protein